MIWRNLWRILEGFLRNCPSGNFRDIPLGGHQGPSVAGFVRFPTPWGCKLTQQVSIVELGGGNSSIFYFHPEPWGDDPIWRAYFSDGLVQPPTREGKKLVAVFCWNSPYCTTSFLEKIHTKISLQKINKKANLLFCFTCCGIRRSEKSQEIWGVQCLQCGPVGSMGRLYIYLAILLVTFLGCLSTPPRTRESKGHIESPGVPTNLP